MATPAPGLARAIVPLLLAAAALALPRPAAAQCTEEPCGPVDTTEPSITISPGSGTYPAGTIGVAITWSDAYALNHNSRVITFGGVNVTSSFSYSTSTGGTAQSYGNVTIGTGASTLTAYICDMSEYGPNCGTASVTYTGPAPAPPAVRVSAEAGALPLPGGTYGSARFRVVNTGTASTRYGLAAGCSGGLWNCSGPADSLTLAAGDSAWVDAYFVAPAAGASGAVWLTASAGQAAGTGSTTVTGLSHPDVGYVGDGPSMERIQRDGCIIIAVAPAAASECGDLRVVHALPGARVLNRARQPVLTYNSGHARPWPIVAAHFAGPAGGVPDSIHAVLKLNGAVVAQQRWAGWGAGQVRRIALGFDASSYGTSLHPYTLEVTAEWLNGTRVALPASRSGRMIVVNRSTSPFGAGWWLSGVEQLHHLGDTLKLWVGGDGSARLYRGGSAAGPWHADAHDRPDSLYRAYSGVVGGYVTVRRLPGGAEVWFDAAGYHVATATAVGHLTRFHWQNGHLGSVVLPSGSGQADTLRYSFEYGTLMPGCATSTPALTRVHSPAPAGGTRETRLCGDSYRRVTRIRDPGVDSVIVFSYSASSRWITGRADRRGGSSRFDFDRGRFRTTTRALTPTQNAISRVHAVQPMGTNGISVREDSVLVLRDGARPYAEAGCDCSWWAVNRWGAPVSVRDPYGYVTHVRREDGRWPALVTSTLAPNGFSTAAAYDARGNLSSVTAINPYGDGRNATTTYDWHPTADAPARVVSPEGEVALFGYDAYGRPEWEQVGPDAARRVSYRYHPAADAYAPGLLRGIVYPGGGVDSVEYNPRGNVRATISPMGARSEFESDRLGRITVQRVAIDTLGGVVRFQGDSTTYDAADRPVRVASFAPSLRGEGLQQVVVVNAYDPDGMLRSVSRGSVPDSLGIGMITTRWQYDLGGRQILEVAPDQTPADSLDNPRDSTVYDQAGNVREVHTRRFMDNGQRVVLYMQYDALNRLTHRVLPQVAYDSIEDGLALRGFIYPYENTRIEAVYPGRGRALPYPWYPNAAGWGYRIPGDTARFFYDGMGNMVRADNRDAWVRRGYYANGALRGDTLKIRTVDELAAGGDSTSHVYAIEHRYDRNGRRTELIHPENVAPRTAGTLQNRTRYAYHPATGALRTVTDPLGNTFTYAYTPQGQVQSLTMPGGLSDEFEYDADGRLTLHLTRNANTSGADRYAYPLLRDEVFRYDARGKMTFSANRSGAGDTTRTWYTGLGQMRADTVLSKGAPFGGTIPASIATQQVVHDALGNRAGMRATSTFKLPWREDFSPSMEFSVYQPGTGRLLGTDDGYGTDYLAYDAAGNVIFSKTVPQGSPGAAAGLRDHAYFYGGDGMLRAAETRVVDNRSAPDGTSTYRRAFEEYRYDALGRRVWVRARRECHQGFSGYCELGWVRRTVWDGDRELYEIQAPSSGEVPYDDARREIDVEPVNLVVRDGQPGDGNPIDPNPFYGRVAYTYGMGIDQPLSVVRMAYANMLDTLGNSGYVVMQPFAIIPLWNSRGQPALGAFADGTWRKCVGTSCIRITWPERWAGYARPRMYRDFWHGTLLQDKADGSGLNYRRNRYYDPATGRFTQEDPIGLAGGLNLYGFAAGDPVTYSDPYGLKVCFRGSPTQRQRLEWQTENAIGADIDVGSDGCVTRVGRSNSPARRQFQELVESDHTYSIEYGAGGSAYDAPTRRIRIDESGVLQPIYSWQDTRTGRRCVNFAAGFDFVPRLIAHELGHAYDHNSRWLGSFGYALSWRRTKEYRAIRWENEWARRNGEPERCRYSDAF